MRFHLHLKFITEQNSLNKRKSNACKLIYDNYRQFCHLAMKGIGQRNSDNYLATKESWLPNCQSCPQQLFLTVAVHAKKVLTIFVWCKIFYYAQERILKVRVCSHLNYLHLMFAPAASWMSPATNRKKNKRKYVAS